MSNLSNYSNYSNVSFRMQAYTMHFPSSEDTEKTLPVSQPSQTNIDHASGSNTQETAETKQSLIDCALADKRLDPDEQAKIILKDLELSPKIIKKLKNLNTTVEFVMEKIYKSKLLGRVIYAGYTVNDAKQYLETKKNEFINYLKNDLDAEDIRCAKEN